MSPSRQNAAGIRATRSSSCSDCWLGCVVPTMTPKPPRRFTSVRRDATTGPALSPLRTRRERMDRSPRSRARDAVRRFRSTARPGGPVVVLLLAGRYELSEPLVFSVADSGTSESPNVYAAAPRRRGPVRDQRRTSSRAGSKSASARGEWVAALPELKGGWRFRHVSVDGQWRDRPRLPDGETVTYRMAGLADDAKAAYDTPADKFEYAAGQIDPRWTGIRDAEIVVVHFWVDSHSEDRCGRSRRRL